MQCWDFYFVLCNSSFNSFCELLNYKQIAQLIFYGHFQHHILNFLKNTKTKTIKFIEVNNHELIYNMDEYYSQPPH